MKNFGHIQAAIAFVLGLPLNLDLRSFLFNIFFSWIVKKKDIRVLTEYNNDGTIKMYFHKDLTFCWTWQPNPYFALHFCGNGFSFTSFFR